MVLYTTHQSIHRDSQRLGMPTPEAEVEKQIELGIATNNT